MNLHDYAFYLAMNGEGGESSGVKNPKLTVNYVYDSVEPLRTFATTYSVKDGILHGDETRVEDTLETLVLANEYDGEIDYYAELPAFAKDISESGTNYYSQRSSNEVNCTFEYGKGYSDAYVIISDPTQDASLTITVYEVI